MKSLPLLSCQGPGRTTFILGRRSCEGPGRTTFILGRRSCEGPGRTTFILGRRSCEGPGRTTFILGRRSCQGPGRTTLGDYFDRGDTPPAANPQRPGSVRCYHADIQTAPDFAPDGQNSRPARNAPTALILR